MSVPNPTSFAVRSAFGSVLLACMAVAGTAQAQSITINQMTATGNYLLNGAVSDSLIDSASGATAFVDVLGFPFSQTSGAGMHSYGSSNGVFGSRSSGFGVFDVNGSYVINLTITNNQATAQNAVFSFHITPGLLELTDLRYTGPQFVEAGMSFNISTSNGKTFASAAQLRSDAGGLSFNTTGDASLYGGTGADRFVIGSDRTLDLGVLAAGESVTLNYAITSYAKGDALVGQTVTLPQRTVTIPGYWISGCDTEVPQVAAAATDAVPAVTAAAACAADPVFVPEQTVTLPETTLVEGDAGGAQASSGDPFAFNLGPNQMVLPPARNNAPVGVTLTQANVPNPNPNPVPNPVPEPGALSLALLALAAAAAATRSGRKPA